jgi:hypothetical protein
VFNSGPWAALRSLAAGAGAAQPATWAHGVTQSLTLLLVVVAPWVGAASPRAILQTAFVIVAAVALLNPAVMPWYLLWALPLAVAVANRAWLVLTGLSLLSYLIYIDGSEQAWWLWLEYGLFAAILLAEVFWARRGEPATRRQKV